MSYQRHHEESSGIPRPPQLCSVAGCTEKPCVILAVVLEGSREASGCFSDFGYVNVTPNGRHYHLRDGIVFKHWLARCWPHYERDLYSLGKGRWSVVTGRSPELTREALQSFHAEQDARHERDVA